MITNQWARLAVVVAPLVLAVGMPGCTEEMCSTEEEKAAAKAIGAELVDNEDCLGKEQTNDPGAGGGGAPGLEPEYKECDDCGAGGPVNGP